MSRDLGSSCEEGIEDCTASWVVVAWPEKIMKEYMYTLKEIIDAWENNYGGDMEKDYPRFFKELKRKYEKIHNRS